MTVSATGLQQLRAEREALKPFSRWEQNLFDKIADWSLHGVPDDGGYLEPTTSQHRLNAEELKLALDKIARFVEK